jgi:hypothetical protein
MRLSISEKAAEFRPLGLEKGSSIFDEKATPGTLC